MFVYNTVVNLGETDAAGVLYFARQFDIIHRAYEKLLSEIGYSVKYILEESSFILPVIHAEADFILPIAVGDEIEIRISVLRIRKTSFTLGYELIKNDELAGKSSTVHIAVDKASMRKVQLPEEFASKLKSIAG